MAEPRAIVPDKGIRPGKNTTLAEIARFIAVALKPAGTTDPNEIQLPALGGAIYGVNVAGGVGVSGPFGLPVGEIGDIQCEGRAKMVAAAAVAVGAAVAVTAAGKAQLAVAGQVVVGRAVTAAAALDDVLEVELVGAAQSFIQP